MFGVLFPGPVAADVVDGCVVGDAEDPGAFGLWGIWRAAFCYADESFLKDVFHIVLVQEDAMEISEQAGCMFVIESF